MDFAAAAKRFEGGSPLVVQACELPMSVPYGSNAGRPGRKQLLGRPAPVICEVPIHVRPPKEHRTGEKCGNDSPARVIHIAVDGPLTF